MEVQRPGPAFEQELRAEPGDVVHAEPIEGEPRIVKAVAAVLHQSLESVPSEKAFRIEQQYPVGQFYGTDAAERIGAAGSSESLSRAVRSVPVEPDQPLVRPLRGERIDPGLRAEHQIAQRYDTTCYQVLF